MKKRTIHRKMTCEQVLDFVCEDLEVSSDSPTCRKIRAHLAECPKCSGYLKSLRSTVNLYRRYEPLIPEDLHEQVMKSLRRKGPSARPS